MATLNSGESFAWMSRHLMNVNFQVWFYSLHLFRFWCFWWQWLVERHIQSIMFCYACSSRFTAISSAFGFVFDFHLFALTQKLLTWWFGIFFPPVLRRLPFTSDNWSRMWKLLSLYVHAPWCFLKTWRVSACKGLRQKQREEEKNPTEVAFQICLWYSDINVISFHLTGVSLYLPLTLKQVTWSNFFLSFGTLIHDCLC